MVTSAVPALGVASRTSYLSAATRRCFTFAARGARVAGPRVSMLTVSGLHGSRLPATSVA